MNEGIGGNSFRGGIVQWQGPPFLSRPGADVLGRPGVTDVIVLIGINDLGGSPTSSAAQVIAGLTAAVERLEAFRAGGRPDLNVLVGTLMPAGGTVGFWHGTPETNAKRNEVNQFIRESGIGDGVVDFDAALRDPSDPSHLHPHTTAATTCIQATPATGGWRKP